MPDDLARACLLSLFAWTALFSPRLAAQDALTAAFDWRVPDRLGAKDAGGMLHYRTTRGEIQPPPEGWRVDFTASASTPDIASYDWSVDGQSVGTTDRPTFTHHFPEEGAYRVALTVRGSGGRSAQVTRRVLVQDWLIVAVGDSYGSGEGNPERVIPPEAIDELEDALANLNQKQAALQDALRDLAEVQEEYDSTLAAGREVRAKLAAYNAAKNREADICSALPPRPIQCTEAKADTVGARADLRRALVAMGIEGLIDTVGAIPEEVERLEAVARASRDAARASVNAAQAGVDAARERLTSAEKNAVATWQDCVCHRSSFAGQAQAALAIEEADPRTSVTFLHLACSGATIAEGLVGSYEGIEPICATNHDDRPQIEQARDLVEGREIDALLTSIGGNDAYFAKIVKTCMAQESCHTSAKKDLCLTTAAPATCDGSGPFASKCQDFFSSGEGNTLSGEDLFRSGIDGLSEEECDETCDGVLDEETCRRKSCTSLLEKYDLLSDYLEDQLPDLEADHLYLAGYPDMTRSDDGSTCFHDPENPRRSVPCLSLEETTWARDEVLSTLNETVAQAAAAHGWRFVAASDSFDTHGYCADDHWFVRLDESIRGQGDKNGGLHPNAAGHRAQGARLSAALLADLYPGGPLLPPRPPRDTRIPFVRGDANDDGSLDVSDPVATLNFLFTGTMPHLDCHSSADADRNGILEITDPIYLLNFLFQGGRPPAAPHPDCGKASEEDGLGCEEFQACW